MTELPRLGCCWLLVALAQVGLTRVAHAQASVSTVPTPIDRHALVTRHNPSLSRIDADAPLMLGNGDIALTADITGLATFQSQYSRLVPLMIQAQWAWHSFPNPQGYRLEQSLVPVEVRGKTQYFPWLHDWSEAKQPLIAWLRENPHRFSLGRLALYLGAEKGQTAAFGELGETRQTLDLWTGRLQSSFTFAGSPVEVETSVHPDLDLVIVRLRSPLLETGKLGIDLTFPGIAAQLNPDPADFEHWQSHRTTELTRNARGLTLQRQIDATRYYVQVQADHDLAIESLHPHAFRLRARAGNTLTLLVLFSPERHDGALPEAEQTRAAVARHWQRYWSEGGVIDFSGSTDPRAAELERRVILSQYLMAINAAGRLPPQEEGLFSNSWNGKFHLEMHPWHAAHFATWGRSELLERSLPWYLGQLPAARTRAHARGLRGAWWPKMVGPEGRESPSTIGPFLVWQEPHPIYLAELLYRAHPTRTTLARYRELVFETAELLASLPWYDAKHDRYVLGPPLIPAQEVFPPLGTYNPAFELAYFRFGLETAQHWRERLGLPRRAEWDRVLDKLSPLPERDGLYLATESQPELWSQARSPQCANGKSAEACLNRDHPSFVAAWGLLPGKGVDPETMRRTLDAVLQHWDLHQTWGWDFPLLAMTAARLHEPQRAVDLLLADAPNFHFGSSGMTPRFSGGGTERVADTYFPSNGSLLLAVGMLAAGWDGEHGTTPGFPKDGRWVVRTEGISPLP